jgi:hypothetical protein
LAPLECILKGTGKAVAIFLKRNQLVRTFPNKLVAWGLSKTGDNGMKIKFSPDLLYVRQVDDFDPSYTRPYKFHVRTISLLEHGFSMSDSYISDSSPTYWDFDEADGHRLSLDPDSACGVVLYPTIRAGTMNRELERFAVVITT